MPECAFSKVGMQGWVGARRFQHEVPARGYRLGGAPVQGCPEGRPRPGRPRRTPFAFRVVSREGPDVTLGDEFGMARRVTTASLSLEMTEVARRAGVQRKPVWCLRGSGRLVVPRPSDPRCRRLGPGSFGFASRLQFIKVGDDQQTSLFDEASREKR